MGMETRGFAKWETEGFRRGVDRKELDAAMATLWRMNIGYVALSVSLRGLWLWSGSAHSDRGWAKLFMWWRFRGQLSQRDKNQPGPKWSNFFFF